ncbi:lysophospholipid acyltransferase family protein [Chitinophaga rhizophila]|uniref:Lauroyl/myristoyl acyltransferase n=1 Tax=Chitinophaga rhizophila TaxID=2866212 RepID=A0ABS7GEA7_9BACT|nr:hypothetical protein [Chitinophaga rhizophila]MBW8686005.1 hypothetical protein [Chitinophaga rhizophila]
MRPNETLLYAATSANLYNFTGDSDFTSHLELFRTILGNSSQAFRDLFNFTIDEVSVLDEERILENLHSSSRIFISFHTGSYYALPAWLMKHGHDVIVMSDTQSVNSGEFADVAEIYRKRYNNNCNLELINVEQQGAIFKLIKRIKAGAIVIGYIDGNKGVGGQTMHNENMLTLDFLRGKVKVRKGVVYLSSITGVPIQLALSHQEGEQIYLQCCGASFHPGKEDREVFANSVLQQILTQFGDHVLKYSSQWANWPYVHNWSLIDAFTASTVNTSHSVNINERWKLDLSRCCPLKLEGRHFVFDRSRYSLFPLEDKYLSLFSYKTSPEEKIQVAAQIINEDQDMAAELVSRQVLAPL